MMNNLNSVLLEGTLVTEPEISYTEKGAPMTVYDILSKRFYKQDDEIKVQETTVHIVTRNRQAEVNKKYLSNGRGVRVVGRIASNGTGPYIEAEHVEFKPKLPDPS
jgi:single-stranded DNA-binding protein